MLPDATRLLQHHFGYDGFRPLQQRVLATVFEGRDVLAVLPTGGGKSLCYQVPALLASGPTIVVSPLIALMQDQVARLHRQGIAAVTLGGDLAPGARDAALREMTAGRLPLLYVSPERLRGLAPLIAARGIRIARLAIDEAHCVVEWGHDFRPAYRRIGEARAMLGDPPVTALTGTATPDVREAITRSLRFRAGAATVVGSFDRPNLHFAVRRVSCDDERLARLVAVVRAQDAPAIVYGPTRNLVEGIARALLGAGVAAAPYHAGMQAHERRAVLEGFLDDRIRVVTATSAFGMGIDKPDVELVVHWTAPASPEAYYQEAGRAGRDGRPARCLLFAHPRDDAMPRRQLEVTYPRERLVEALWTAPALRQRHAANVLASVDRLAEELRPDRGRVEWGGVRRRRREAERRLAAMARYANARRCRRASLLAWFGEQVRRCGGCDVCG
ncbi:MAG TPA: RecQ family ATP-dependent DNA helicase, partial [Gemmatimonadales bacterium]|nr:RecQ family ATP-dependent DNA helicase [Gemmatimonadales bacterium]